MEERMKIASGEVELEGLIRRQSPAKTLVAAHPHPLYGGSMHNNVVQYIVEAGDRAGWSALRFNFRGVGRSTGVYDDGNGEMDDLCSAVDYLSGRGAEKIVVAGYSFGAWVACRAWAELEKRGVSPLLLVAPPLALLPFDGIPDRIRIGLMIGGEKDELAPVGPIVDFGRQLADPIEPVVIPKADHFFGGHEMELLRLVGDYLNGI